MLTKILATFLFTLLFLQGCEEIKYESDIAMLSSGIANSPEVLVKIDGVECKDSKGFIGGCYIRHKKNTDITFSLLPVDYVYKLEFKCSSDLGIDWSVDVTSNTKYEWKITKDKIENFDTTICRGRIYPQRAAVVSSFFEVRFIFVDSKYIERESIIEIENKIILGANAYKVIVFDGNEIKKYDKKTMIDKLEKYCILTESESQRYNSACKGLSWQQL